MSRIKVYEKRTQQYCSLTRPDGSLLSEKDCLLLDLCIQWTKNNKITTSTYDYLLKNKFPRQNHRRTVKRTFDNISLYIKAKFKNIQVVDGVEYRNKILIERAPNFDSKVGFLDQKITGGDRQGCPPQVTKVSTPCDNDVHPCTPSTPVSIKPVEPLFKITPKITTKNDHSDHIKDQNDQFKNVEKIVSIQKESSSKVIYHEKGKEYWAIPLIKFRYNKAILEEIRIASEKPHFPLDRIQALIKYIANKDPNKLVKGGVSGFKKYVTQLLNGENEYQEKISLEDSFYKEQKELERRYVNNEIKYFA